jgi:phage terminase large subunit-like protein
LFSFETGGHSLPEKQRRRFFEGEWSPEIEGALWTLDAIERTRIEARPGTSLDTLLGSGAVPALKRVVVAVDPSGASGREGERSDEIGIVVAGLGAATARAMSWSTALPDSGPPSGAGLH